MLKIKNDSLRSLDLFDHVLLHNIRFLMYNVGLGIKSIMLRNLSQKFLISNKKIFFKCKQ